MAVSATSMIDLAGQTRASQSNESNGLKYGCDFASYHILTIDSDFPFVFKFAEREA